MSSKTVGIKINKNINDEKKDFDYLFRHYHSLKNITHTNIYFDFDGCKFLQQNAVAFLGALIRLLQKNGNTVYFDLPSIAEKVRTNLEQNGFLHELGLGGRPWNGNSIPYREDVIIQDNDYTNYLSEKWLGQGWISISEPLKNHIISPVIEAYINVFDHAKSNIGVITCGQRYPSKGTLKLALVDLGVGIPFKVRDYLKKPMPASETLKWAFKPGTSTLYRPLARGNGLKILQSFIQGNNGKLEIYSDTGYACIDSDGSHFENRALGFEGTLVQITLICNEASYSLPDEEDYNSDEFFF